MNDLASKKCKPCEGGVAPLSADEARALMKSLHSAWRLDDAAATIERHFEFKVFSRTIAFANAIAWIATNEGHHPQLTINYGSCNVQFTTHAISGLSENDFICAAKVDRLASELR